MATRDTRSVLSRLKTRHEMLRDLSGDLKLVLKALAADYTSGLAPDRVLIRSNFARREKPYDGLVSDRRLPPPEERPPSVRLMKSNGIAQPFYLTTLFVAQTQAKGGQGFTNKLRTVPGPGTGATRTWADYVAVPLNVSSQARGRVTKGERIRDDNRKRQIYGALRTLAGESLVHLPNASSPSRQYEDFRLLEESGVDAVALRRYAVPTQTDAFSVPASFFVNGWHLVLTRSEIAFLLMLWQIAGVPGRSVGSWIKIASDVRLRSFAISPAAYGTHRFLADLGLVEVEHAEGRHADGTFEGVNEGADPLLHQFRLRETAFDLPAISRVLPTLQGRIRALDT